MKILCIGDSNTFGFDPRSYLGERYPEGVRWTDRLKRHTAINFGINGITIPSDHAVYVNLIKRKDPDLVIVMLGTNDVLQGAGAAGAVSRMDSFLTSLKEAKKPILLIAQPPVALSECVPDEETVEESKKLGGLYRDLAEKKGVRFLDAGKWGIELAFDGVHFSPDGHARFAEKLEEEL